METLRQMVAKKRQLEEELVDEQWHVENEDAKTSEMYKTLMQVTQAHIGALERAIAKKQSEEAGKD